MRIVGSGEDCLYLPGVPLDKADRRVYSSRHRILATSPSPAVVAVRSCPRHHGIRSTWQLQPHKINQAPACIALYTKTYQAIPGEQAVAAGARGAGMCAHHIDSSAKNSASFVMA